MKWNISHPGNRRFISKMFFDTDPEEPVSVDTLLEYFSEHFAGYRGLAAHYFWEDLFWRRKYEPVNGWRS